MGLGESDETLRRTIDDLTEKGIIPVLRAVYPHPLRAGEAVMERPSKERLLDLAGYLKDALEKNGLDGAAALDRLLSLHGLRSHPGTGIFKGAQNSISSSSIRQARSSLRRGRDGVARVKR